MNIIPNKGSAHRLQSSAKRIFSALTITVAALTFGVATASGAGLAYRYHAPMMVAKSVRLHNFHAFKYLPCAVVSHGSLSSPILISHVSITNNSGVPLDAGKRIYLDYKYQDGHVIKNSFVLSRSLPVGASNTFLGSGVSCTAQVDLFAKNEPIPLLQKVHN